MNGSGLATREAIEQISEAESEDHGPSHAEAEVRHVERHIAASCHVVREHQQCHESRQHNHNHPAHNSFPPLFRCFESFREWVVFFWVDDEWVALSYLPRYISRAV